VVHVYQASLEGQEPALGRLALGAWFRDMVAAARRDVEDEGFAAAGLSFELVIEHGSVGETPAFTRQTVGFEQELLHLPTGATPIMAWLRARHALRRDGAPCTLGVAPSDGGPVLAARRVLWSVGGHVQPTAVFALEALTPENRVSGPCLVESRFATIAVPPGWTFTLETNGWMHLHA
jgi:hypothetical protein